MTVPTPQSLQEKLAELDRDFVMAERPGETDDQLAAAVLEWILQRERVRHRVVADTDAAHQVDQQTIQKMRNWDSDDPGMSTVEKILRRLAVGRGKDAMSLVRALQEKARLLSEEMRRRASVPRKLHPVDELIEQFVRVQPTISEKLLLRKLEGEVGGDVISTITDGGVIEPHDPNYPQLKVSGLKNRLSGIKKKISR
jgi:hypothetical protein